MFSTARIAVLALVAISHLPATFAKPYPTPIPTSTALFNATQLEKRDCSGGIACGYYGQQCCYNGDTCGTNAANEAICVGGAGGPVVVTSVYTFWASATEAATATATCTGVRQPCGSICCESGYYCLTDSGTCKQLGGGSSGGIIGTLSPSAPLRPTSSTLIIVTATGTPTATVPFETPISTGVNGVPVETSGGGGGLSSGAIAGIVIGVLLGLFLLFLLCLFCCFRALFDTLLACFGGGKRKHTHEETYIEEHHHSSGGAAAAGGGRRWYGQGPARPARSKKSGGGFGNALGIGALLGGAALALGLKRKHDKRHDDKSTTISGSSAYYSDDYTSSSE
jgi:ubiquitin-activating enzyme E1